MRKMPPCGDWAERLALKREDLSPADQAALDNHLKTCDACAMAYADYHFLDARLRTLPAPTMKPLPRLSSPLFMQREDTDEAKMHHIRDVHYVPAYARQKQQRTLPTSSILKQVTSKALLGVLIACLLLLSLWLPLFRKSIHPAESPGSASYTYRGHTGPVSNIAWSPDGKYIASAGLDRTVQVWDANTGSSLFTKSNTLAVNSIAWSPDGKYLALVGGDGTVQIWDVSNGSSVFILLDQSFANGVVWSPDGKRLAVAAFSFNNNVIHVLDAHSGRIIFTYGVASMFVMNSIIWSPDGKRLTYAGYDDGIGMVDVWEASNGHVLGKSKCRTDYASHAVWSPDGKRLALSVAGGIVQIRDASCKHLLTTYEGYTDTVFSVAWSPDGKRVALAGTNKADVWDASSGHLLSTYEGHTGAVLSIAWSPDGKRIASAGEDGTVQVWQTP